MDKKEIAVAIFVAAVLAGMLTYTYTKYDKCHSKGGAYVQGQCLKVEVIK